MSTCDTGRGPGGGGLETGHPVIITVSFHSVNGSN